MHDLPFAWQSTGACTQGYPVRMVPTIAVTQDTTDGSLKLEHRRRTSMTASRNIAAPPYCSSVSTRAFSTRSFLAWVTCNAPTTPGHSYSGELLQGINDDDQGWAGRSGGGREWDWLQQGLERSQPRATGLDPVVTERKWYVPHGPPVGNC
jgi:hypothetical protein